MKIVDTDAFLDMPHSSQLLYFHLSMRADDDGFVSNPKKILRMIGSQDDDFKVLLTKRFILPFDSGICVIKHWKIHNYIQKDRYTETVYLDEKNTLDTKNNGSYTECIQNGYTDKIRLGKVSIVKSKSKNIYGELGKVKLTSEEYYKLIDLMGEKNVEILIFELDTYIASKGKKYNSHYATLLSWARRKSQEKDDKRNYKKVV